MTSQINRVAVIGMTIGVGIAAYLTQVGIPVLLLDVVPFHASIGRSAAARNRYLQKQYEHMAFSDPTMPDPDRIDRMDLLTLGNLKDDFDKIADCDWIIDAAVEPLILRQLPAFLQQFAQHLFLLWSAFRPQVPATYANASLMKRIQAACKPGSIVSNATVNSLGFPLYKVADGLTEEFKARFLGVYIANPPRFTRLVEIVSTPATAPAVTARIMDFCAGPLARQVVLANDTPDLISNRMTAVTGSYGVEYALERGYQVDEVDTVTGLLIGRPDATPTFQAIDTVGAELLAFLGTGLYPAIGGDPYREALRGKKSMPLFRRILISTWLGSPKHFHKQTIEDAHVKFWVLNFKTLGYEPEQEVQDKSVKAAQPIEELGERLRALLAYDDRAADYVRNILYFGLSYAAYLAPYVAQSVGAIDAVQRYGVLYEAGPFEIWDMLGVAETVVKMESAGFKTASWVKEMLSAGNSGFYQNESVYNFKTKEYEPKSIDPQIIRVNDLRKANREIAANDFARLLDMGDGVALLEFHNNPASFFFSNTIAAGSVAMSYTALEYLERQFDTLVIGNDGTNFSSGANVATVVRSIEEGTLDHLGELILSIADVALKLRYNAKPVVPAIHQIAIGAGAVFGMSGWTTVAAVNANMGFAEAKLGVVAAAGGCKELLRIKVNPVATAGGKEQIAAVRAAFQVLASAKLSNSAWDAKSMGFLKDTDTILVNSDYVLAEAKRTALQLASVKPSQPRTIEQVFAIGPSALDALQQDIQQMFQAGQINDYESRVLGKTAYVVSGGAVPAPGWVDPAHIFALETEAFLSLLGEAKTQEKLRYLLKTGGTIRL